MTVLDRQSLADLALQEAGSADAILDLAIKNNISATRQLDAGRRLQEPDVINKKTVQYYRDNSIRPATWINASQWRGGIGYMNVNGNFKIS